MSVSSVQKHAIKLAKIVLEHERHLLTDEGEIREGVVRECCDQAATVLRSALGRKEAKGYINH